MSSDRKVWLEAKRRLCDEFKLNHSQLMKVLKFCYPNINFKYDVDIMLNTPISEVRRSIKRTLPKYKELTELLKKRENEVDLSTNYQAHYASTPMSVGELLEEINGHITDSDGQGEPE